MAQRKKSPKSAKKKTAVKTNIPAKRKPAPTKTAKKRKISKSQSTSTSRNKSVDTTELMAVAQDDPTGCCTWTNSAGGLMMQDMRQSQCMKKPNSIFSAGVKCNG